MQVPLHLAAADACAVMWYCRKFGSSSGTVKVSFSGITVSGLPVHYKQSTVMYLQSVWHGWNLAEVRDKYPSSNIFASKVAGDMGASDRESHVDPLGVTIGRSLLLLTICTRLTVLTTFTTGCLPCLVL